MGIYNFRFIYGGVSFDVSLVGWHEIHLNIDCGRSKSDFDYLYLYTGNSVSKGKIKFPSRIRRNTGDARSNIGTLCQIIPTKSKRIFNISIGYPTGSIVLLFI